MTDESHQVQSRPRSRRVTITTRTLSLAAGVIVLCLVSFAGGRQYQKHHGGTAQAAAQGFAGRNGFGGARRNGSIGDVTAISSSSITVDDQRSGSSKTYGITSSTQISDNGSTVDYSDIKTGDAVLVTAASSTSTTATRILVNPSFGGGMGTGAAGEQGGAQSQ